MLRLRKRGVRSMLVAYGLATILALGPLSAPLANQAVGLDGNPANGDESRVVTRVLQSFPVKVENVVHNEATGKSFTFNWPGAGPGGFSSLVVRGPDVGTKWEWTTVSQVFSLNSPATFTESGGGLQVFGSPDGGLGGSGAGGEFMLPGKSIFPTQVTISSACRLQPKISKRPVRSCAWRNPACVP